MSEINLLLLVGRVKGQSLRLVAGLSEEHHGSSLLGQKFKHSEGGENFPQTHLRSKCLVDNLHRVWKQNTDFTDVLYS